MNLSADGKSQGEETNLHSEKIIPIALLHKLKVLKDRQLW